MENNYPKAYKEVIEILKYVPKESVEKISQEMIDTLNSNMDNNYNFSIDMNKSFEEQELLEETKAILANIFRDYWATPYQKERILAKERYDRQKIEEEKRTNCNYNLFNKNNKRESKEDSNNSNLPTKIRRKKFFYKIIEFLKKIFNRKG